MIGLNSGSTDWALFSIFIFHGEHGFLKDTCETTNRKEKLDGSGTDTPSPLLQHILYHLNKFYVTIWKLRKTKNNLKINYVDNRKSGTF